MLSSDGFTDFHAYAFPLSWRIIAGALVATSRAGLLLVAAGLLAAEEPITLLALVHALAAIAFLPGVAAWLIARAFVVEVEVHGTELVMRRRELRIEIPHTAIARVAPWTLPLPGPGFSLWMRSGRRLRYGLQADDPTPLLSALADIGGVEAARVATRHAILVYAHAGQSVAPWRWYHALAKFVGFALLPTALWFNAHQHIAFGGLLGQYYLEGLGPYLTTFAISWGLASIYLLLYASVWRAAAEGVALLAAWASPVRAATVRRAAERACQLVYYAGVPVLVLVPFLR